MYTEAEYPLYRRFIWVIGCVGIILLFCIEKALSMDLKFADHLAPINDCPDSGCKPKDRVAYRIVHSDMAHPNNFLPVLIISPSKRDTLPRYKAEKALCRGYGLSLYTRLNKIQRKYRSLINQIGEGVRTEIGTHIAEGEITKSDGICTSWGSDGHFNLFEYEGVDLSNKFTIVADMRTEA